jgi:phospholipase D
MKVCLLTIKNIRKQKQYQILVVLFPLLALLLFLIPCNVFANAMVNVCFSPQKDCLAEIVDRIVNAKSTITVQAYSIDSKKVIEALKIAHKRGVTVSVFIDGKKFHHEKMMRKQVSKLVDKNIPVWLSKKSRKVHNKIIIIDKDLVITGSANYTKNESQFSDNILFISDKNIASAYIKNWHLQVASAILLNKSMLNKNIKDE